MAADVIPLADCELADAIERGALDDVTRALQRGASFEPDPVDGVLPLHRAIIAQHVEIVSHLCASGADPSRADDNGANALDLAATLDSVAVVAVLVAYGAPLNGRGDEGYTPLMSAAGRSFEIATLLVSMGADLKALNDDGRTALQEALALGDLATADLILSVDDPDRVSDGEDRPRRRPVRPASSSL
ncbi:MAG: ankyrin repeat domain-containing protein [Deltaproteobacteria bacterium]